MLTYGFYNSVNKDRRYDAEQIGALFDGLITDGVFANYKSSLNVTPGTGFRELVINPGKAWFNGTWTTVDDNCHHIHLLGSAVDATYYIYLAVNKTNRVNSIAGYTSERISDPGTGRYFYLLAQVNVPGGVTEISQSMIIDTRGSNLCPYVTGILETVSFEEIVREVCGDNWQAWLDEYSEGINTAVNGAVNDASTALALARSANDSIIESNDVTYMWAKYETVPTGAASYDFERAAHDITKIAPPQRKLFWAPSFDGTRVTLINSLGKMPVTVQTQLSNWRRYPYFYGDGLDGATDDTVYRYDELSVEYDGGVANPVAVYTVKTSKAVVIPSPVMAGDYVGTVVSDSPFAYPKNGPSGEYWYIRFSARAEDIFFDDSRLSLSARTVQEAIEAVYKTGGTGNGSGATASHVEVDSLPDRGVSGIIYVVKNPNGGDSDEYIWLDRWEKLGSNTASGGNSYTLPVANSTTLGGVKAQAKTEAMTQPVGIDANGNLYTLPGGGEDGATFTPAISEDATLSWSNNKGLDNPAPVNIRGPKGDPGGDGFSPSVVVTQTAEGAAISVTDKTGTTTATILNGKDGQSSVTGGYPILCTFADAYAAWRNGETFPVAFMGDSTFSFGGNSGDHVWFPERLQAKLREECGHNTIIYNAGIPGIKLTDGIARFDGYFGEHGTFADAKMVGIGYGINDRLDFKTLKEYKAGIYERTETIILKCYGRGIQPFLLTHQATLECGVGTEYQNYPLRDSHSMAFANVTAKRELAAKYGIPLIELNQATEEYLLYSKVPANVIMMDTLHFDDIGHEYEAGFLFSQLVSRTISIEAGQETVVSYASQHIRNAVPEDKVSYGGKFKIYANYSKSDSADTKIFDAYVFIKGRPATLQAHKADGGSTYIKINGTKKDLDLLETDLGVLDLGLHHLEVFTGASTAVNFSGFVLNKAPGIPCTAISLDKSELAFAEPGEQTLTATVTPANTTDTVTWSSDNTSVVTVSNGVVATVGDGSAIVTAKCGDYSANCNVSVTGIGITHYFPDDGTEDYIKVNGGHVEVYCTNKIGGFYNLSNMAEMTASAKNQLNINNRPEKFEVSSGDVVTVNVSNVAGWVGDGSRYISFGIRNTSNGNLARFTIEPDEEGNFSETANIETGGSVGCLYLYLTTKTTEQFELDVEVSLNGNPIFG